ncbi:Hypothetical protein ACA1_376510 [Acanthamoeba castellanii str. Neff]|uniref:DUF423 domain-containing protein n=1 Tax=Acanthamoeba castellanii (strain ATCC 30010 / Neff) TaxID=1257118 RepID=L8HHK4_ACACF|nr:Hypothetical protein ACA1_376510 [Acanthamoeba castellanii str. Neff]ELR24178.1 Hypothetical protein ACA1_376510 [Acanthamoeba castellanii str. Neff]
MLFLLLALRGVLLGAFGAHALKTKRSEALIKTWETAVHYQFIHAIGLLAVAFAPRESRIAGWSFVAGTVLFSGSLYGLVLTEQRKLGAITPIGGLLYVAGWLALFWQGTV